MCQAPVLEPEVDVQLWGALESDSESEEESDEEEEEEEADATGLVTPGDAWVYLIISCMAGILVLFRVNNNK